MSSGRAQSTRDRLLRIAKERREDFNFVLLRYGIERLVARLAASTHGASFVIKGATLFSVWASVPHRATKDLDLLGVGEPDLERLAAIFREVATPDQDGDGLVFDPGSIEAHRIKEDADYEGVRVTGVAKLRNPNRPRGNLRSGRRAAPGGARPDRSCEPRYDGRVVRWTRRPGMADTLSPRQTGAHQRAVVYQALITDVATRLDAESMRRAKALELDLTGAVACRVLARRALAVAQRFDAWGEAESTFETRKADLDEYFEVLKVARTLGVDLIA